MSQNPEQVVFDAFRPYMFPSQASHQAHVAVTALRAAGLLKEPQACGCGPTEDEAAMSDADFNALCQELYETGEAGA